MRYLFFPLIGLLLLTACGQTGPLYLPRLPSMAPVQTPTDKDV